LPAEFLLGLSATWALLGNQAPMNVVMNPVINVHGVPADKAGEIADRVRTAVGDSSNALIARLKEAKKQESRLGYV
jgi:hypothetical protein